MAEPGSESTARRVRELEAIARVASNFTFEHSIGAMMEEVSRQVVLGSGSALTCIVGASDPATQMLTTVLGSFGASDGFNQILQQAWRTGGTPAVSGPVQTRKAQILELDTLLQRPGYELVREAQHRAGWQTMAVVPLIFRSSALGVLIVAYPHSGPDAPELAFLEAIADQAAVALENSRLFEQARSLAVAQERQRFSRELHDSVSQALYAISLGAQTARELLSSDPATAAEPIDYVVSLADAALAEMRVMIFDLRPEALAAEGLLAALRRQAASVEARHQIAVSTLFDAEPPIPLDAKEALYRIAQEAIHNVVKHARASNIRLSLTTSGDLVTLQIRDDGRGFDTAANFPGHLGLTSMSERATRVGAKIDIQSAPGEGCAITVTLPVEW